MFIPGQLVVCTSSRWRFDPGLGAAIVKYGAPRAGRIYEVREVEPACLHSGGDGTAFYLKLVELVLPAMQLCCGLCEVAWNADQFRPIDESKIDLFRKLVEPAPSMVPVQLTNAQMWGQLYDGGQQPTPGRWSWLARRKRPHHRGGQ